jgi:RimJ/RimL family protein N-acetyltransferase
MAFGWEGDLVRLVPIDRDRHLANCLRWLNDPAVTENLLIGDFPLTRAAEADYFERMSKPSDTEVAFAIETLDGEHLGMSGLHRIDWQSRTAHTGTFLGDPATWGKGYGGDSAKVRTAYAFEVLGLRQLWSGVFHTNEASIAMLKRAGYVEAGVHPRKFWKRGRYVDEVWLLCERA